MTNPNPVDIAQQLRQLPNLPGVYKMLGDAGQILYVGKAKNLKNRVSSYFTKTVDHPKTRALVAQICNIDTMITRSETEALLLEQNLIKTHKPPFNIMLRDDKSYLYIYISSNHPYPRLASGRGRQQHIKGKFFGPYPSAASAKQSLLMLHKLFMMRSCEDSVFAGRERPCLEYQIKRCSAPCMGYITPEDYAENVKNTVQFLQGDTDEINQRLIKLMTRAAENLAFEQAAKYRNQLTALRDISSQQAVYTLKGEADVLAIAAQAGLVCIQVLNVRGGRVLGGKSFFPDLIISSITDKDDSAIDDNTTDNLRDTSDSDTPHDWINHIDLASLLSDFMASFYFQYAEDLPAEIITNIKLPDERAFEAAFLQTFNQKVQLKNNTVRGDRAEWLSLADINVQAALKTKLASSIQLDSRFKALAQVLGKSVNRIECFDISHTMGESPIASCVVFDHQGAVKKDYRHYAIKDITAGDDYAAMAQVLTRRYQKQSTPDLILIDGGKGQLNKACEVMQQLDLQPFMVGISKGEGRKAGLETLHFTNGDEIHLEPDHKALHLLMQVRDEAHRFAITKHRAKRDKKRGASILEVIPGLGPIKRRELLSHFGGIQQLLGASQQDIAQVKGFGDILAHTIYKTLHG